MELYFAKSGVLNNNEQQIDKTIQKPVVENKSVAERLRDELSKSKELRSQKEYESAKDNLLNRLKQVQSRFSGYKSEEEMRKGKIINLKGLEIQIKDYELNHGEDKEISDLYNNLKNMQFGKAQSTTDSTKQSAQVRHSSFVDHLQFNKQHDNQIEQQPAELQHFGFEKQDTINQLTELKQNLQKSLKDNPYNNIRTMAKIKSRARDIMGDSNDPDIKKLFVEISNIGVSNMNR